MKIYERAYRQRLSDCLDEDFPRLKDSLGELKFNSLRNDFLNQFTSPTWTLAEVSLYWGDYIQNSDQISKWDQKRAELDVIHVICRNQDYEAVAEVSGTLETCQIQLSKACKIWTDGTSLVLVKRTPGPEKRSEEGPLTAAEHQILKRIEQPKLLTDLEWSEESSQVLQNLISHRVIRVIPK